MKLRPVTVLGGWDPSPAPSTSPNRRFLLGRLGPPLRKGSWPSNDLDPPAGNVQRTHPLRTMARLTGTQKTGNQHNCTSNSPHAQAMWCLSKNGLSQNGHERSTACWGTLLTKAQTVLSATSYLETRSCATFSSGCDAQTPVFGGVCTW